MKTRNTLNLGLVIIVITLVLFVIYEPGINKPENILLTDDLNIAQVSTIVLERNNRKIVKLLKKPRGWQITVPYRLSANEIQVYGLLSILNQKSLAQIESRPEDLDKFGLKNPPVKLILDDKVFSIGTTDPIKFRRYILVDGKIHLINDAIYRYFSMEATRFISNTLLPENKEVIEIDLPELKFSKNSDSDQWVVSGTNRSFSADRINTFLDAWRKARAIDVTRWAGAANSAVDLENKTGQTINIYFSDQTRLTFTIISTETDFLLGRKDAGIKYRLPEKLKTSLFIAQKVENPVDNIESPTN